MQGIDLGLSQQWNPSTTYTAMMQYRRTAIFISCLALLINIIIILKKRQYVFTTLKLFMFVQIFYFLALLSVLLHYPQITIKPQIGFDKDKKIADQLNQIVIKMNQDSLKIILCSLESWINLATYNISYFFGVLISLNVRKVLDSTHKNFMKQYIKIILISCGLITLVYFIPFVFSFQENFAYSYGPAGFHLYTYWIFGDSQSYSLFYCSFCVRQEQYGFIAAIHMAVLPILLFLIHSYLLFVNSRSIKYIQERQQVSPKQWFVIQTGYLGIFLFIIQAINFFKFILTTFFDDAEIIWSLVVIINILFDLLPLGVTAFYYKKYYQKAQRFKNQDSTFYSNSSSLISDQDLVNKLKKQENTD